MENRANALLAGMFLVIFLAAALASLWWFGGQREATRDVELVSLHSVSGLNPQVAVRYRGVRVGKVSSIEFDPEGSSNIIVTVSINSNLNIASTATARMAYQGLTGQAFVLIEDTPMATPLKQRGDTLRLILQPSFVSEGIDDGMEILRQMKQTLALINGALSDDNRQQVASTLNHVERLTGNVAAASDQLPQILARLQQLASDENLSRLDTVLNNVSVASGEVGALIQESRQLVTDFRQVAGRVDQTIDKVDQVDASVFTGTAGRVNKMTDQVGRAVENLDRLIHTLEESPQSIVFGRASRPLGPGEADIGAGSGDRK